jgi:hypothetical protein
VREIEVAHPSKRKGSGFELEVVKVLQGYAIDAVKIPLSGGRLSRRHRRGADKARYFD